jgi:hypothetical protein
MIVHNGRPICTVDKTVTLYSFKFKKANNLIVTLLYNTVNDVNPLPWEGESGAHLKPSGPSLFTGQLFTV